MQNHSLNVDETERDKFDSLARDWWDPHGRLRTLHHINPVRLRYIEQQVALKNKRVLDLGCGGGLLAEAMAKKHAVVTGLDINHSAIAAAENHKQLEKLEIDYVVGSAEQYAEHNEKRFDVITCMELLEHVPDVDSLLNACSQMLKPGGDIFLATINRSFQSYMAAIVAVEYCLKLLPKGTHDYAKFIKPSELNKWLLQRGFKLIDLVGMRYLPGINKCSLTHNPSVNYIAHARLVR